MAGVSSTAGGMSQRKWAGLSTFNDGRSLIGLKERYSLCVSEELFILSMKQTWLFSLCMRVALSLSSQTKDTYGEKEVKELEGYSDIAQHRYMYIKFSNSKGLSTAEGGRGHVTT